MLFSRESDRDGDGCKVDAEPPVPSRVRSKYIFHKTIRAGVPWPEPVGCLVRAGSFVHGSGQVPAPESHIGFGSGYPGASAPKSDRRSGVKDQVSVDAKRILLRYGAPIAVLDDVSEEDQVKFARIVARTELSDRQDRLKELLIEGGYMEEKPEDEKKKSRKKKKKKK
ncbi:MAG: hypothetical protein ACOCUZ_02110 [bacterium]